MTFYLCQPSNAAWIATLVMWRIRHQSSLVLMDNTNHKPGFDERLNLREAVKSDIFQEKVFNTRYLVFKN